MKKLILRGVALSMNVAFPMGVVVEAKELQVALNNPHAETEPSPIIRAEPITAFDSDVQEFPSQYEVALARLKKPNP